MIVERSNENQDFRVQIMKLSNLYLYWHEDDNRNQCWVPFQHIVCLVDLPYGRSGKKYTLKQTDFDNIKTLLPENIIFHYNFAFRKKIIICMIPII